MQDINKYTSKLSIIISFPIPERSRLILRENCKDRIYQMFNTFRYKNIMWKLKLLHLLLSGLWRLWLHLHTNYVKNHHALPAMHQLPDSTLLQYFKSNFLSKLFLFNVWCQVMHHPSLLDILESLLRNRNWNTWQPNFIFSNFCYNFNPKFQSYSPSSPGAPFSERPGDPGVPSSPSIPGKPGGPRNPTPPGRPSIPFSPGGPRDPVMPWGPGGPRYTLVSLGSGIPGRPASPTGPGRPLRPFSPNSP